MEVWINNLVREAAPFARGKFFLSDRKGIGAADSPYT